MHCRSGSIWLFDWFIDRLIDCLLTGPHVPVRQWAELSVITAAVVTAAAVGGVGMSSGQSPGQHGLAESGIASISQYSSSMAIISESSSCKTHATYRVSSPSSPHVDEHCRTQRTSTANVIISRSGHHARLRDAFVNYECLNVRLLTYLLTLLLSPRIREIVSTIFVCFFCLSDLCLPLSHEGEVSEVQSLYACFPWQMQIAVLVLLGFLGEVHGSIFCDPTQQTKYTFLQ